MILAVIGGFFALRFVLGGFGDLQSDNKFHVDRVRLAARLPVRGGLFAFRFVLGGFGDLQSYRPNHAKILQTMYTKRWETI